MTALTKPEKTPLPDLTGEQVQLIKDTIAREQNLTDNELRLFIYTASRLGLDPLAKQIYAVRRKGKIVIQTGIDGFRAIAARTNQYAGSDDAIFVDENKPHKATVTVYRIVQKQRCAFTASARWEHYYPGKELGFMWDKMPHVMLGKCAEGLALRKAFPAQLSGVYSDTEMEQAGPAERGAGPPTMEALSQRPQQLAPDPTEPTFGRPENVTEDGEIKRASMAKWPLPRKDGKQDVYLADMTQEDLQLGKAWARKRGGHDALIEAIDLELDRRRT